VVFRQDAEVGVAAGEGAEEFRRLAALAHRRVQSP
jgi:hypothetical protein